MRGILVILIFAVVVVLVNASRRNTATEMRFNSHVMHGEMDHEIYNISKRDNFLQLDDIRLVDFTSVLSSANKILYLNDTTVVAEYDFDTLKIYGQEPEMFFNH